MAAPGEGNISKYILIKYNELEHLVSVFCCVGGVGAGQPSVVPSEGGEVVDRRADVVAPQLVLAPAAVLPRLLLQPAGQWFSAKDFIRLWLANTLQEPPEPHFICRHTNDQNQILLTVLLK